MDRIIGLKEFRNNVDGYVKRINKGYKFIVLKRGKPVFELSPVGPNAWEEVIDFTKIKKGGVNIKEILKRL
jgi:antitoxin (DNA-binding transcriptional repressor) of toxin-antitoxin stability system